MTHRTDFELLWNSLPVPALLTDAAGRILAANSEAESFLQASERGLARVSLEDMLGEDSRILDLLRRAAGRDTSLAEFDITFAWPRLPERQVDIHAAPLQDDSGAVLVTVMPRALAESIDRSMTHRGAARSVAGMAGMIAHEVKNPLAGISGAAQLLEMSLGDDDRELTRLIRHEAERIGTLIGRVEEFGDIGPPRRAPVNIHDVLDRARLSAEAGFARHARFVTEYDPSLPPTAGDADQLMQVILNLMKNAGEAAPQVGGVITLRTCYRPGMKIAAPSGARESLPLEISVADNGPGVPEDLQRHIFEPFVTSKSHGTGLGLSLVSKIVADHGGVISCTSRPGATVFRLLLPVWAEAQTSGEAHREGHAA